MKGVLEMKEIRAAPQSPCGKKECIDHICRKAPHCEEYRKYLKAIKQMK